MRNTQGDGSDAGIELALPGAIAVSARLAGALVAFGAKMVAQLLLEQVIQVAFNGARDEIFGRRRKFALGFR